MCACVFRTLDLGFEKDLTVILNSMNSAGSSRQNVLLSATLTHGKYTAPPWIHTQTHTRPQSVWDYSTSKASCCSPGVTRLADICLKDPVSIHVSGSASSNVIASSALTSGPDAASQSESFAVPEALKQFLVVVPSKIRLVCLAAFILDKCKVKNEKINNNNNVVLIYEMDTGRS